jgi:hypothetical protein
VQVIIVLRMLIHDDHIMHDDISIHDVPKHLLILKSSWFSHNRKLGLQNPKCSLHIFPSLRLCITELKFSLTRWFANQLHTCFSVAQKTCHTSSVLP